MSERGRAEEIARNLHWNGVEDRVTVIAAALELYAEEYAKEERERLEAALCELLNRHGCFCRSCEEARSALEKPIGREGGKQW